MKFVDVYLFDVYLYNTINTIKTIIFRPYKCEHCHKSFKQRHTYVLYLSNIKDIVSDYPHDCYILYLSFIRTYDLI